MKNVALRTKLFFVLGILTVAVVAVAALGLTRLSGMNERLNSVVDVQARKLKL